MIYSPMEQFVLFPVLNINISINNVVLYLLIAAFLTILITKGNQGKIISNHWGILSESLFRTILNMIESFVGKKYSIYLPLFYTIFHIVLFSNLLGLTPYSTTPTVELVLTLTMSFTLLVGLLLVGFLTHKIYLLAMFLPSGTPNGLIPLLVILEVLAYLIRILSLGLRQGINLITGHVLLKVVIGFIWLGYVNGASYAVLSIPIILLTLFLSLEVLIAYLQSYIFVFITILTLKDVTME